MTQLPEFFFDVGSPYAYLSAERIEDLLGPVTWVPVLLGGIFRSTGRSSWAIRDAPAKDEDRIQPQPLRSRAGGIEEVERRAAGRGLPPIRWPDEWPNDGLLAMRVATWAAYLGNETSRAYARAAMRVQFAEGRALSDPANVHHAAREAGLDPDQAITAASSDVVKQRLRSTTDAAVARGVFGVPTVAVGAFRLWGDDRLEDAATIARTLLPACPPHETRG